MYLSRGVITQNVLVAHKEHARDQCFDECVLSWGGEEFGGASNGFVVLQQRIAAVLSRLWKIEHFVLSVKRAES